MKKMLKKMGLVVMALALAGNAMAFAEGEAVEPTPAPVETVVVEEKAAPVEATPAPTEVVTAAPTEVATAAPTEEATAAPTEEATVAPTEEATVAPTEEATAAPTEEATAAPTEEATAAPTEEATVAPTEEPTVAPTEEPTVAPTEEPTVAPTEEPTVEPTVEPTPVAFTGEVEVKLENDGEIYFGDTVKLRADVRNANADYSIRWEVNREGSGDNWETIKGETSSTYSFVVTEENAGYAYRAVLVVAE